ncbi:MAG: hypothetical protein U0S48_11345 [Solirubrobacteraceae bacterium]
MTRTQDLNVIVRDGIARAAGVVALAGIGLIHLLDAPGKFEETPYMGWMYVALIAGCLVVGAELIRTGSRLAWSGAALLALSALVGFTLTRTVGLPQATGDIGNWGEPLGLASLFVEGCVVALSLAALAFGAPVQRTRAGAVASRRSLAASA